MRPEAFARSHIHVSRAQPRHHWVLLCSRRHAGTATAFVQRPRANDLSQRSIACRWDRDGEWSWRQGNGRGDRGMVSGGSVHDALEKIKANTTTLFGRLSLAEESCASFASIVNNGKITSYLDPQRQLFALTRWKTLLSAAHDESKKKTCSNERRMALAQDLKKSLSLAADVHKIASALAEPTLEKAMAGMLTPAHCAQTRISIPNFDVKSALVESADALKEKIESLVAADRPVITGLCANPKNGIHTELGICVNHVVIITGHRELCCGATCTRQYKIQDSGATFSQRYRGADFWANEADLLERMVRKQRHPKARSETNLTWVEKR